MATGRPHLFAWGSDASVLSTLLLLTPLLSVPHARAEGEFFCGIFQQVLTCFSAVNEQSTSQAQIAAEHKCLVYGGITHCFGVSTTSFSKECAAVAATYPADINKIVYATGKTSNEAIATALNRCQTRFGACAVTISACDGTLEEGSFSNTGAQTANDAQLQHSLDFLGDPVYWKTVIWKIVVEGIWNGIGIGLGILLVACAFWKREPIVNLLIHGNLPYKLPVYGEHIQCLFKRTQRVNWYGRVIFGIVVNLAMTHQQLIDIRKYWLGRVVAFDSLRRQRQNQLANMHYQLAAAAKSEAHDKKKFWSRRWATVRTFFRRLFWIFAALFRLLLSLFFIRVNIAKLVRGTVIESKDLTLILQAKEAIEETAAYLKEYLETANTFDGRDEVV